MATSRQFSFIIVYLLLANTGLGSHSGALVAHGSFGPFHWNVFKTGLKLSTQSGQLADDIHCLEKRGLSWNFAQIHIPFDLLCVSILFQSARNQLCFRFIVYAVHVPAQCVFRTMSKFNVSAVWQSPYFLFCFCWLCTYIITELVSHQLDILVTIIPWRDSFYWLNALPNSVVRWVISTGIVTQCGRMSHQHRDCHSIYYLMLCSGGSLIHTEIDRSGTSTGTWELQILLVPFMETCNNNNHRELIERFWNLKALYNLKKNIQCTNTHNYTNHSIHAYKTYEN